MNIFILDSDPVKAAQYQCNKHIVKMILESAQMLCFAFPVGVPPYKNKAFRNHPCSVWARSSSANFDWLVSHALALCAEFEERYGNIHKSKQVILWCKENKHLISFPSNELTKFAIAMPDDCKVDDPIESYRTYYRKYKRPFAKWPEGKQPSWW